jgi:Fe-S cluster biogenesis protein NfuA
VSEPAGDSVRTACHGCRTMRETIEQVGDHRFTAHSMIVADGGTVYRRVRAAFDETDVVVEGLCPQCGESENPGWLPGFRPPT